MQSKGVLHNLLFIVLAGLFFTVFIRFNGLMNAWGMSKVIYIIGLSGIMSLVLAIEVLSMQQNFIMRLNLLDLFVLLFIGYIVLQTLFMEHSSPAIPYLFALMVLTGIYFLLKGSLQKAFRKSYRPLTYILMACFLGSGLIQAVYGLLQLYGLLPAGNQYFAVTGSFVNPDHFAGYLATIMPFAAGIYLLDDKKQFPPLLRYVSGAALVACLLVLPAAYIRGSWLAVTAGVGLVFAVKYHFARKIQIYINTTIKKVVCVIAGLCLLGGLGAGLYQLKPDSAYGRLFIWKVTSSMVADSPVFGMGFDKFKTKYNNYQAAYFASGAGTATEKRVAGNVQQAHNEYLQILAEEGIVGLILFGGILYGLYPGFKVIEQDEHIKALSAHFINIIRISAAAALLSAGVVALFSFPFHILPTAVNIMFLGACCSAWSPSILPVKVPFGKGRFRIAFAALLVFVSMAGFYYSYHTFTGYKQWKQAVRSSFGGQGSADSLFVRLYPEFQNNGQFLFTYGSYEARSDQYEQAIPLLEEARKTLAGPHLYALLGKCYQETKAYAKAEKNLNHAAAMRPSRLYPRYLLARFYANTGHNEEAILTANQVLSMNGKKETTAAQQIKKKMRALIETADRSTVH